MFLFNIHRIFFVVNRNEGTQGMMLEEVFAQTLSSVEYVMTFGDSRAAAEHFVHCCTRETS